MHAERQVGFVVAHPQCGGRDQRFHPVVPEPVLQLLPVLGPAGVGGHVQTLVLQERGHPVRLGHGEHVDDPGPLQRAQRLGHPGVPLQRRQSRHHGQAQRRPRQRPAQRHCVLAELGGDVRGHPLVRRRGGSQDRGAGGELEQGAGEALVVRTEVEAPVGDAVRLVDHQHAHLAEQLGQPCGEPRVGEPFWRDQQHVQLARRQLGEHLVPLLEVRGVDRRRA